MYISPAQEGSVNFDVTITSLEEELTTLKSQLEKITSEIEELQNELQTLNNSTNIESQNVITENITNTEVENSTTTSNTETEQKINNIKKSIEEKTATKRELEEKIANYTEKTITTSISVKVTQNSIEEKSDLADKEDKKLLGQDDKEMTSMISSMKKMMNQVQELEGNLKTANDTINSMTASVTYQGSQNNYLSTLSLSEVELKNAFKKTTQTYFATVGNDVSNVTVNATAEDSSAIVTVYGNENLQTGKNKILITVTADDGSTRTYKVYVTKQ